MRVADIRLVARGSRVRATATVSWEAGRRGPLEIYFEVDAGRSNRFRADANAFLLACYLPAIRHGEPRIAIDGAICPRLARGLDSAANILRDRTKDHRGPIPIEPSGGWRAPTPPRPERAAVFLSGGVDSLHLIRLNRRLFPYDHPQSFHEAISVNGLFFAGMEESAGARDYQCRLRRALSEVAADARLDLVEVSTNIRQIELDQRFLAEEWIGAALSSSAHCFPGAWSSVTLASGRDIPNPRPSGTQPLLDPCYSTAATDIRHEGIRYSRLDKIRDIATSNLALRNLVVCFNMPGEPTLNCGQCEKCLRTMAELAAIDALAPALEFPFRSVTAEMIRGLSLDTLTEDFWRELPAIFRRAGNPSLAAEIDNRLADARRTEIWHAGRNWKGQFRKLDRRLLGGRLLAISRRLRGAATV